MKAPIINTLPKGKVPNVPYPHSITQEPVFNQREALEVLRYFQTNCSSNISSIVQLLELKKIIQKFSVGDVIDIWVEHRNGGSGFRGKIEGYQLPDPNNRLLPVHDNFSLVINESPTKLSNLKEVKILPSQWWRGLENDKPYNVTIYDEDSIAVIDMGFNKTYIRKLN